MSDPLATATLSRLREHMDRTPFDWLVLGSRENVGYVTGYRSVAGDIFPTHQMVAIVSQTDVILVAPAADVGAAGEHLALDYIEPFGTFFFETAHQDQLNPTIARRHENLAGAFSSAIRRFGVAGRVGVDGGLDEPAALAAQVPGLRFESVGQWMQTVRSVKLKAEVDRLAEAARLADEGIQAALATASSGVSERDLAAVVGTTMAAGGGTPRFIVVTSGERSALSDAHPTSRLWQKGELLRFDVGCTYDGYWSDLGRTAVLGEPSDLQVR
ncbi:MAG: M24 family metallopeptidase, partial [Acidimicrobiia bacterium]|nr:M24 family metallopeptidase [Acidimicrobiia bacterium]